MNYRKDILLEENKAFLIFISVPRQVVSNSNPCI